MPEVRAVVPNGAVVIMATPDALRRAREMGLDDPDRATGEPPTAKAMDYGQWEYKNKKSSTMSGKTDEQCHVFFSDLARSYRCTTVFGKMLRKLYSIKSGWTPAEVDR